MFTTVIIPLKNHHFTLMVLCFPKMSMLMGPVILGNIHVDYMCIKLVKGQFLIKLNLQKIV